MTNDETTAAEAATQHATDAEFDAIVANAEAQVAVRAQQIFAEREAARAAKDLELFEIMKSIHPGSTEEEVLAAGRAVKAMKDRSPLEVQRRWYVPGARFTVVKEGARAEALIFFGETNWAGWSRNLQVGEVVELVDWRKGWNSEALVPQFAIPRPPHGDVRWLTIAPVAGLFRPYPHPGFLEPYDEGDEA